MSEIHLPPGFRLEEYEIVRVLGAGGFGITYEATDHQLRKRVALKEYFPDGYVVRAGGRRVAAASTKSREVFAWGLDRFLDEARLLARLDHPNIVRVYRYFEANNTAYIVMEYIEGDSLSAILQVRERLSAAEWQRWLDRLLDGLAHVHDHGYLHRDVKPGNIMIRTAKCEPVLIDFGAARAAARDRTHTQVFTRVYAPIEQHASQGAQGPPTDIYALAAVSCEALTGEPPQSAPDRMLDDRYEPLAKRVADADAAWLTAIDQGMALRPEKRPQTVAAWRATLFVAHGASAEAVGWYRETARLGDARAQFTLGLLYANGKGVPENGKEAVVWYRRAADQGHARAQYNLGWMYANGKGVPADEVQAAAWYREAADQGHAKAIFGVSVRCLNEVNVPDDDGGEYLRSSKCTNASETGHVKAGSQFEDASYGTLMLQGYPILQEYQEFVDSHYRDLDDHELENDEEEHLTWFYTMYEDLRNDSGGFELVFDSLCNEDSIELCDMCAKRIENNVRCDECAKKREYHREMILESVVSHVTTGLECCRDDRAEVLLCCDSINETLSASLGLIDNVDMDTDCFTDDIGGSVEKISDLLSTSSWFEDWKQDKYAIDVFVKCIGKLRDCQKNVFRALRRRYEREFANIGIDGEDTSVDSPHLLRNSM